jgi:hypothetical protein
MTEKGDMVRVSGYGEELYVVTGFSIDPDGEPRVDIAGYHKDDSLLSRLMGGRCHTGGHVAESRLISPLPGFGEILASGPDVKPILEELKSKQQNTNI